MKKWISTAVVLMLSLNTWANEEFSMAARMYDSGKARSIGDLVTIIISETSSTSKAESMATSKTATKAATPNVVDPLTNVDTRRSTPEGLGRLLNSIATLQGLSVNSSDAFNGSGSSSTSETLTAQITARVVDVMPNGTLVIKGERRVKMKKEEVSIIMTGIIRKRDISQANTINSSLMSDAQIYYETDGDVSDGTQPGFLWRLIQHISPF
ncbi:MAG: flagellar basal body L-ring protein FlgH [Lentisphaeraceae bacterium]|nr:flagellar basal body L-ring protein FlgH [Lentisphaeraceae bacterium]